MNVIDNLHVLTAAHCLPASRVGFGTTIDALATILDTLGGARFARLFEPFAGSAALTIAARQRGVARAFVIGDSLGSLVALWQRWPVVITPADWRPIASHRFCC